MFNIKIRIGKWRESSKCHMSSLRIIHEPRFWFEFGEIGVIVNERAGVDVFLGANLSLW